MCKVLNLSNKQTGVYIGRPSKWGNPFAIGPHGDRATVISLHERWLRTRPDLLRSLEELRGKDLMCFCAPEPCHGDLLMKLANGTREELIAWAGYDPWEQAA